MTWNEVSKELPPIGKFVWVFCKFPYQWEDEYKPELPSGEFMTTGVRLTDGLWKIASQIGCCEVETGVTHWMDAADAPNRDRSKEIIIKK